MSRGRKKKPLIPWLSARNDNIEKRFIQIGASLFSSNQFLQLSPGAKYTYLAMAMHAGGKRTFTFPTQEAGKNGIKKSSFWNYVTELEKGGFIIRRSNKNLRLANEYEFCDAWKLKK